MLSAFKPGVGFAFLERPAIDVRMPLYIVTYYAGRPCAQGSRSTALAIVVAQGYLDAHLIYPREMFSSAVCTIDTAPSRRAPSASAPPFRA
jgi:hypothetical protein